MRRAGLAVIALSFVGCFSPKVKNRGFACDGNYPGACPAGFTCVNNVCDDGSGGTPPPAPEDMTMPGTGGNGGSGGGGGGGGSGTQDMAMAVHDLAMPPPPDMAMPPPPDMASSCAHSKCTSGGKLNASCDPCVTQICASDALCCQLQWDSVCVGEVTSICGLSCP